MKREQSNANDALILFALPVIIVNIKNVRLLKAQT
jgi:hypothetical protein